SRLELAALVSNSFSKSGETTSLFNCRTFLPQETIISNFRVEILSGGGNPNQTVFRAAVPDHVGHTLTYDPCENGICALWKRLSFVFNSAVNSGSLQDLTCAIQFAAQSALSI